MIYTYFHLNFAEYPENPDHFSKSWLNHEYYVYPNLVAILEIDLPMARYYTHLKVPGGWRYEEIF